MSIIDKLRKISEMEHQEYQLNLDILMQTFAPQYEIYLSDLEARIVPKDKNAGIGSGVIYAVERLGYHFGGCDMNPDYGEDANRIYASLYNFDNKIVQEKEPMNIDIEYQKKPKEGVYSLEDLYPDWEQNLKKNQIRKSI
jgi:hypothetical protein